MRAALALGLIFAAGTVWPQEAPAPPQPRQQAAEEPPSLDAVLQLVREQQQLIARQKDTIQALESRLGKVEALALSSHNRLEELAARPAEPEVAVAVEKRLAELEQTVKQMPEKTDLVSVGEFPGSFRIPGTDAAIKLGGQVSYTSIHNLTALGSDESFVTSSIPIEGTDAAGKTSRINYIASPSRLNFDMRTPTGVGEMRAFIEADFAGGTDRVFRLRHGFGQWRKFLVGQTWSTFADPEAEPDGIDFEGLNAISLFRQPQIRWTQPLRDNLKLALALENPNPQVTGANGVNQVPDVVLRLRWEPSGERGPLGLVTKLGHLHAGFLLRQVRAEALDRPNTTLATGGFGFNLSGRLNPGWWNEKDDVTLALYAGKGSGRYITDLRAIGGQDAVYDPVADSLLALPFYSAYLGYEHWWSDSVRSTLTGGWVFVDNVEIQAHDAFRESVRFSLNVAWSPIPRLDVVGEFLAGQRRNKDGQRGRARQFQFGTRFRF
jgi:hypothetical protein